MSTDWFSLPQNLALMAGAGAGKTHSLVTIALHLLGGAREGEALRPSKLCLLTFTDKAAAELRERLRRRLDALALGAGVKEEQDLRRSFAVRDRGMPPADFWRAVRDDLGSASIGTFHSLCVQILRRAPAGLGIAPAFELLEERDARELIHDLAQRVVLEQLESNDPLVTDLCQELGFAAQGRGIGLVEALVQTLTKLREEGLSAEDVPLSSELATRRDFDEALLAARKEAASALREDGLKRRSGGIIPLCARLLETLSFDNFFSATGFPALREAFRQGRQIRPCPRYLTDLQRVVQGTQDRAGLLEPYAACLITRHEEAFRTMLSRLASRHQEELSRRGVLDFSELLIRARDLLRDHPSARRELQDRFAALLVDEFQDTNRLQLDLVTLISERREGGPRAISEPGAVAGLPLEPRFLCAVGDRKQSIYEFRGADVSVFSSLAAHIEGEGGQRHFLKTNRRSSPQLLAFFNRLFTRVMAPTGEERDYEVAYDPSGDDLEPHRKERGNDVCVERIVYDPVEKAGDCRALDAEAVARRVRQLLAPRSGVKIEKEGRLHRPEGRDIALLFRRFSYLEVYRQALTHAGVPHRVVRGRGFYGAQEVLDLASLLKVVSDPNDPIALAAVLRSPLVALSDASLFKVALATERRMTFQRLADRGLGAWDLPPQERARLDRFLEFLPRLRKERDRLGVRVLLRVALEATDYRLALAGTPYGEQALANVEKLLTLAGRRDAQGVGDAGKLATELLALADADPSEAQADVVDSGDPRAVQLLTIHQAKGLEWPIVFVPDLAAPPKPPQGRVLLDRGLGLAIKPWLRGETVRARPHRLKRVAEELSRRASAEHRRVLYVALTRARDRLVLSGQSRMQSKSWRDLLDTAIAGDAQLRAQVLDVRAESLPKPPAPAPPQGALGIEGYDEIDRIERRVRERPAPRAASAVFPVTQLQDFFLCPRRFLYAHHAGLSEHPAVLEIDSHSAPETDGAHSVNDARFRGTVAHALLEQVDLALIGDGLRLRPALTDLLWSLGLDPADSGTQQILGWAERFLQTPFAARLKAAGRTRVHRELPFLLRLGGRNGGLAVHLKGKIDLLFEDEDGGATVLDYKTTKRHPQGLSPYGFQLDCYALAARHFVQEGVQVRTGVAFLREREPGPDFRETSSMLDPEALEHRLVRGAEELLVAQNTGQWSGRLASECAAIQCGYQYRCHGGTAT